MGPEISGGRAATVARMVWGNLGYDRPVVAVVLLPVVVFVWIARRLRIRREQHDLAERALAEAEAIRREQEIVDDLEARFNDA